MSVSFFFFLGLIEPSLKGIIVVTRNDLPKSPHLYTDSVRMLLTSFSGFLLIIVDVVLYFNFTER